MEVMNKSVPDMEVNLADIFSELMNKKWVIIFSGVFMAAFLFLASFITMAPQYAATVSLYANNMDTKQDINNVSYADLTASIMIANTCSTIIKSDLVLNEVIEDTGVSYNKETLLKMLYTAPIQDTEIIEITVKAKNPKEAAMLVNSFAAVSTEKLTEIVEGSSVKILNEAEIPVKPVGPSYLKIGVFGGVLGCAAAIFVILLLSIFDVRVKSEKDLEKWDYPVLGVVPDATLIRKNQGGYYRRSQSGKTRK